MNLKIRINDIEGLINYLESNDIVTTDICRILSEAYGVYADPVKVKDEVLKGFVLAWNNYHLKGLEMPIFI